MKLVVTNKIGEKLYIEVDEKTHVNGFEEQISKRVGIDVNEFRKTKNLFFQGKLLPKSKELPLCDLGFYNGGNLLLLDKRKLTEKSRVVVLEPMIIEEIEKRTKVFGSKVAPSPAEKLPMNSVGEKLIDLFQALLSSQLSEEEEQPENEEQNEEQNAQPNQQQQQQPEGGQEGEVQQQQQQAPQQEEPKLPEVNADQLEQLRDMGFPEERARKALLLTGDPESALNWLFQHEDDPHADDPLTEEEIQSLVQKNATQVNEQVLRQLLEMGFPKEDCITALQLTNNNYERACSWLLGDRELPSNPPVDGANIVQLLLSPMIQSMQSNPQIAQSLQDPRTLIALQEVINNPRSISNYVNDPVIAPVLLEAVRFLRRF